MKLIIIKVTFPFSRFQLSPRWIDIVRWLLWNNSPSNFTDSYQLLCFSPKKINYFLEVVWFWKRFILLVGWILPFWLEKVLPFHNFSHAKHFTLISYNSTIIYECKHNQDLIWSIHLMCKQREIQILIKAINSKITKNFTLAPVKSQCKVK